MDMQEWKPKNHYSYRSKVSIGKGFPQMSLVYQNNRSILMTEPLTLCHSAVSTQVEAERGMHACMHIWYYNM